MSIALNLCADGLGKETGFLFRDPNSSPDTKVKPSSIITEAYMDSRVSLCPGEQKKPFLNPGEARKLSLWSPGGIGLEGRGRFDTMN